MTTEQKMKAAARESAKDAPKADPKTASRAVEDAQARSSRRPAQPIYATQNEDRSAEDLHHDKDQIVSEFDDPAANTV